MSNSNKSNVEVRLDLPYGGGPQGNLCVDTYLPTTAGPHPALLCLHGGAWLRGSQRQYRSWGPWLAERGYAVIAVDYRLSSQISPAWPGVWEDVCGALDWLNANAASLPCGHRRNLQWCRCAPDRYAAKLRSQSTNPMPGRRLPTHPARLD